MITYLKGEIILKKERFIIVETGGIGYKVFLSRQTLLKIPENKKLVNLFIFQDVKENALDLYGFLSYEELEFFEMLNNVRGVGPKAALEIASLGSLQNIKERILRQDETLFENIPGIGKKKAMAIILELTGKIKNLEKKNNEKDIVFDALINLGFSKERVKEVLLIIPPEIKDTQEKIKFALKKLGED